MTGVRSLADPKRWAGAPTGGRGGAGGADVALGVGFPELFFPGAGVSRAGGPRRHRRGSAGSDPRMQRCNRWVGARSRCGWAAGGEWWLVKLMKLMKLMVYWGWWLNWLSWRWLMEVDGLKVMGLVMSSNSWWFNQLNDRSNSWCLAHEDECNSWWLAG